MIYLIFLFPLLPFILFGIIILIEEKNYEKTTYYKSTHNNYLRVKFDAGLYGEYLSYEKLKNYERYGAKFLFNCYVPKNNDETTEIDLLMIHKTGIYVVESKNYSGWIFGDENSYKWTQTLPNGGSSQKEHFYNPIKQNKTHIKWLQSLLNLPNDNFSSLIVFSDRCTLKSVNLISHDIRVLYRFNLDRVVSDLINNRSEIYDQAKIDEIEAKLYPYTQTSDIEKIEHVNRINSKLEKSSSEEANVKEDESVKDTVETNLKLDNLICPKCGSPLVIRKASKGANAGRQFYGCSSFPKCRYVKNI